MRFEHLLQDYLKTLSYIKPEPDFFASAIRSARMSQKSTREKIIADVAEALGCDAEALRFLFEDASLNDNDMTHHMPEFRHELMLEAAE